MPTLEELSDQGQLVKVDPLGDDELPWRTLYATPDFIAWLEDGLPKLDHKTEYSDLTPLEQVVAVLAEYASGEDFFCDRRFKKLNCNPDHCVWEFKTEEVRIFGWAPSKNSFICCFGDGKDAIVALNKVGMYIARTVFVRTNIPLGEPKYLNGRNYEDVISNKD